MIRRAFADLPDRQVHFRHGGGDGVPLVMLHASPGSSKQLEPLLAAMSMTRHVIAPDMPGNGDSTPLALPSPRIADYAAATLEFLDALALDEVDLYGSHTGGCVATELAILAPGRVRKVILDGENRDKDAKYIEGPKGWSLTLEVYRHADPACAFGIYSQERPAQGPAV